MHMKVPEVKKCCCCCPLRWGIILFGYINLLFSIFAVACLLIKTDILSSMVKKGTSLEEVTSTVLFGILGMSVILNILLLYAGYKKDITMLRLYNFYTLFTTMASLIPTFILLSQLQYLVVVAALFAIVMQCYVLVLVSSEILKLEKKKARPLEENPMSADEVINVPDTVTLF